MAYIVSTTIIIIIVMFCKILTILYILSGTTKKTFRNLKLSNT